MTVPLVIPTGASVASGVEESRRDEIPRLAALARDDKVKPVISSLWLAAGAFLVYALGACRTIYVGDSGELVAAAHVLGIAHPTSYPLYVLLGKLWSLAVPIGSIAFRMSLFSAAAAAAAVGVLHATSRRLGLGPLAAAFAALLLAFAPSFWGEANVQRVYALNGLFVVLATAAAFAWHRDRERGRLALAFFLAGLGATNHMYMALFAVALGAFVLLSEPALLRRPRELAAAALALLAGLVPYLYLPLRSRADPVLDWGNPETLGAFLANVTRSDFQERAWIEGPADLPVIAADFLSGFAHELAWAGALLAIAGVAVGRRRGWPVLLPLLAIAVNVVAMAAHGSRSDLFIWHRYYIPSFLMGALLAGMGCQALVERMPRRARFAVLVVPAAMLVLGWNRFDRSDYRIADDFSRTLLATLPPGAHLSASDDNILFVLIYLHHVEGLRPDVDLILSGVGDADLPALRFDPDTDPLFFTHHPNWSLAGLRVDPVGLVFQTVREGRPTPEPVIPKRQLEGEDDPRVPKDYLTSNLIGHFHYMLGVTAEPTDWPTAAREFALAEAASPDNDVLFYNLGLIYSRNGLFPEALAAFERSAEINPRHIASNSPVRPADKVAQLAAEVERLRAIEESLAAGIEAEPGTPAFHETIAQGLEAAGEPLAAAGHRLRAASANEP
jgi:tetratricopeptide (TPR) repeat protein